jgi:hypothetical protein
MRLLPVFGALCCTHYYLAAFLAPPCQGPSKIHGIQAYMWLKKGLPNNFYWSMADKEQLPVELDQVGLVNSSLFTPTAWTA